MRPATKLTSQEEILAVVSMSKLSQKSPPDECDELSGFKGILAGLFLMASLYIVTVLVMVL